MIKGLIFIIAALFVVGSDTDGSRRSQLSAQEKQTHVVTPAVKGTGWTIPGLEGSRTTTPRKLLQNGFGPRSTPIYVTVLRPKENFTTTIPTYRIKDGQTLVISERKVVIDLIIKCDVDNRVFAYIVQCTIISQESDGRTGYSGTFGVHYEDRDGDGKFETFSEGAPFVTSDLQIPNWVSQ